jgi:hypothetical protein
MPAGEYLVVLVRQRAVRWFARSGNRFEELSPGEAGLFRSRQFPGLWLDPQALLSRDSRAVRAALEQGLATDEHRRFVEELAARAGAGKMPAEVAALRFSHRTHP